MECETCPYCGAIIEPESEISVEKYPDGKVKKWTEVLRCSDNKVISTRIDEYTYHKETGAVNTIVQKKYDDKDVLIESKTVAHDSDGNISTSTSVGGG